MKFFFSIFFLLLINLSCFDEQKKFKQNSRTMESTIKEGENYSILSKDSYERNDIVLIEIEQGNGAGKKLSLLARIIALPDEEIMISKRKIYIDGIYKPMPKTAKYHYKIMFRVFNDMIAKKFDVYVENSGIYDCFVTAEDSTLLFSKYKDEIIHHGFSDQSDFNHKSLLRGKNNFGWDIDNFGPIKIPIKGTTELSEKNKVYLNKVSSKTVNNKEYSNENYFFVISDNFHNGWDSRNFGLISHSQIKGCLAN